MKRFSHGKIIGAKKFEEFFKKFISYDEFLSETKLAWVENKLICLVLHTHIGKY